MISDSSRPRSIAFLCDARDPVAGANNISAAIKGTTPNPFAAWPAAAATRHTSARVVKNKPNAAADIVRAVGSSSVFTPG